MAIVLLKCPHCGGDVQLDDTREYGFCIYCGTKILIQQDVNNINVNVSYSEQANAMKRSMKAQYQAGRFHSSLELADQIISLNSADPEIWFCAADSLIRDCGPKSILDKSNMERLNRYLKQYCLLSNQPEIDPMVMVGSIYWDAVSPHYRSLAAEGVNYSSSSKIRECADILFRMQKRDPEIAGTVLIHAIYEPSFTDSELNQLHSMIADNPSKKMQFVRQASEHSFKVPQKDRLLGFRRLYDIGYRDFQVIINLIQKITLYSEGSERSQLMSLAQDIWARYGNAQEIPAIAKNAHRMFSTSTPDFISVKTIVDTKSLFRKKANEVYVQIYDELRQKKVLYGVVTESDGKQVECNYPEVFLFEIDYNGKKYREKWLVMARKIVDSPSGLLEIAPMMAIHIDAKADKLRLEPMFWGLKFNDQ